MAMAMARLASRKLHHRLLPSSSLLLCREEKSAFEKRFCTDGGGEKSSKQGREVAVTEGGIKSKLFPKRRRKRNLWRGNSNRDFVVPALYEFFPSGLGNALMQATKNINKLLSNLPPVSLIGTVKEQDDCYKLRYEMPGLAKEDLNITIEDGYLTIKGEHKEEKEDEESDDDEHWSVQKYGYYDTRVMLPEDVKPDEIKAELKDGVLSIVIPRSEKQKKDVKEIQVD